MKNAYLKENVVDKYIIPTTLPTLEETEQAILAVFQKKYTRPDTTVNLHTILFGIGGYPIRFTADDINVALKSMQQKGWIELGQSYPNSIKLLNNGYLQIGSTNQWGLQVRENQQPVSNLGHTVVYRAFVLLSGYIQDAERVVFFECEKNQNKGVYLANLLNMVWSLPDDNANKWLEHGDIYNIYSVQELMEINLSDDPELRVLETGSGPDGIHYAAQCDVDLFVTPKVAQRLQDLVQKLHSQC